MKFKNYIVTIVSVIGVCIIAIFVLKVIHPGGLFSDWLLTAGILNMIVFFFYIIQNSLYDDMSKRKKVLVGTQLYENENINRLDYSKSSNNSFVDGMGYGFNLPNVVGFGIGLLMTIIAILL